MKFLIVAAVLACASAAPALPLWAPYAGFGLVSPVAPLPLTYSAPLVPVAAAAPVAAVAPVPSGDLQGAAVDAQVDAVDKVRAAVDATSELHDHAAEIHGEAVNSAQDLSWQLVDAAHTAQAQLDGAAAEVAPNAAKQFAGGAYVAPVVAGRAAYALW